MSEQLKHGRARVGGKQPPARRPRVVVAVLVAVAVVLTGSTPHGVTTEQAATRVVPPFYGMLYLPNDQNRRIVEAKDLLVTDCMVARGHHYAVPTEDITKDEVLAALRPFGLESLDDTSFAPLPPEPVQSEEYVHALFGDPDQQMTVRSKRLEISWPVTGCQAESEYRLLGNQRQRASELRLRLYDGEREAMESLDRDQAFAAANQRWRTCLRQFGFDAPSPAELLSTLPGDTDLANNQAVHADLQCKAKTRYLDTAYARLATLQQNWIDAHTTLVSEWLTLRNKQDVIARQILTSHQR